MDEFGAQVSARRWRVLGLIAAMVAGGFYWFTLRTGCIEAVAVTQTGGRYTVDIRFHANVRYRGHFPPERGQVLQIQVDPEWYYRYAQDRYFELGDLDLRVSGGSPVVLLAYESGVPGGPLISIRFSRVMRFRLEAENNRETMRLVMEPDPMFAEGQK